MPPSKRVEKTGQSPTISNWISGFVTVYPRHGAPLKLPFPCTMETQLLLQRLEQEQINKNGMDNQSSTSP
jgi:hypothetical protein